MKSIAAAALAGFVAFACAGAPTPEGAKGGAVDSSGARTATPSASPAGAKGGSPPPIPGVPSPVARCVAKPTSGPLVLIGEALYEVTDPIHPTLLCQVSHTVAQLTGPDSFTYTRRIGPSGDATELVLHTVSTGSERVIAGWPMKMLDTPFGPVRTWTADGNEAATAIEATDPSGNPMIQIWLYAQPPVTKLYEFIKPLTDCICRFGLPKPVLAFSPDGQYLVSGWPLIKSGTALRVYRVADQALVASGDLAEVTALWSWTGHHLLLAGPTGAPRTWTPETGFAAVAGASTWPYDVGLSPDGTRVAYTAYVDPATFSGTRVYVYNGPAQQTRMLTDQPRSEVTFVKAGWVWYREEKPCTSCAGQTGPTDKVFAKDLAGDVESPVVFADGESPAALQSGWSSGEFWPSS